VTVDSIFNSVGQQSMQAAQQTLSFVQSAEDAGTLMNAARRLIFLKGNDSHDYKFSSATLEDYYKVSPDHRNRFLAASTFYLKGSSATDNNLVTRIRAALG
jgi:hypothetical protein